MKAVGCTPYVEPDILIKGFLNGDVILMCSDGLTNMVTEDEICKIIMENPTDATKLLVQKANDNGGRVMWPQTTLLQGMELESMTATCILLQQEMCCQSKASLVERLL